MKLMIVESPSKAKTIQKYLGDDYQVMASFGHLVDLPKSKMGVDIQNNFAPEYSVIYGVKKKIDQLKTAAKKADQVVLATDPDREGEAIAYHLQQLIDPKKNKSVRVTFNEITKTAVNQSIEHPRQIDQALFDAQQARRVLDRLIGYLISPILWRKIRRGLSAGRVQSAALKLIIDRQREIDKFIPEEYWNLDAEFNDGQHVVSSKLISVDKEDITIDNQQSAQKYIKEIDNSKFFQISEYVKKNNIVNPPPPFTTSSLQQTANTYLNFSSKRTMSAAQKLYENGAITYMRTDSLRLSSQSLAVASSYIKEKIGEEFLQIRNFSNKNKNAQDAHEAIRPTNLNRENNFSGDEQKIYQLIFNRFISSQLKSAIVETQIAKISDGKFTFEAKGEKLIFEGFYTVSKRKSALNTLPDFHTSQPMQLNKIIPSQHFTKAPNSYTEASLIKELESDGIGRPSTFSSIIETLKTRKYIKIEKKLIKPTEIGTGVNEYMEHHFDLFVDKDFTAEIEKQLDQIETDDLIWQDVVKKFYLPLNQKIDIASADKQTMHIVVHEKITDQLCQICGAVMVVRDGKYGSFWACSRYPDCKFTMQIPGQKKRRYYRRSKSSSKET